MPGGTGCYKSWPSPFLWYVNCTSRLQSGPDSLQMFGGYYIIKYVLAQMNLDPEAEQKEQNRLQSAAILRRLDEPKNKQLARLSDPNRPRKEDLRLTQYEEVILQELVFPEDISVSFEDIGGLSDIIEDLRESVIYPLTLPELYSTSSSLLAAPSGVLLYGPPGCGKTMLAKALAHESGACFINLHISTVTNKWFGDSNKLVNAVFSLARKLEPVIVFIDEIDAVLGTRHSGEHEASGMVKAEFMTHWDGLASANTSGHPQRILILGATNRINDIDDAILRRMPKKFPISGVLLAVAISCASSSFSRCDNPSSWAFFVSSGAMLRRNSSRLRLCSLMRVVRPFMNGCRVSDMGCQN